MKRLSEELLDQMERVERDNDEFVELVRGYRQFRAMLRELGMHVDTAHVTWPDNDCGRCPELVAKAKRLLAGTDGAE